MATMGDLMKNNAILLDGHSLLYRAYHAIRPLSSSITHEATHAIYGFTNMLLKVLEEKPTYVAVAFDAGVPSFRSERFAAYKAQRPTMPEDLRSQVERAKQLLDAFNIRWLLKEGFEADDLIATLATKLANMGIPVVIVTGDLDALQLVSDFITVRATVKGVSETKDYTPAEVRARYGIEPWQIPAFKALKGDPSDNIPGVPGIGEKTASVLLSTYKTIDELYMHLAELDNEKLACSLADHKDQVYLSLQLAQNVLDVPIDAKLDEIALKEPNYSRVLELLRELDFKSIVSRLLVLWDLPSNSVSPKPTVSHHLTEKDAEALLSTSISEPAAIDIVVEGKQKHSRMLAAAVYLGEGRSYFVDFTKSVELGNLFAKWVESNSHRLYVHDAKQMLWVLDSYNVCPGYFACDTQIAGYLVLQGAQEEPSLVNLASTKLKNHELSLLDRPSEEQQKDRIDLIENAAVIRAKTIYDLAPMLINEMSSLGMEELYEKIELPLAWILFEMEKAGVAIDVPLLMSLSKELSQRMQRLQEEINEYAQAEININSPRQLADLLFNKLMLKPIRKTKTGYSTDASTLEELRGQHPVIDMILEYRQIAKLKSTYVDALPLMVDPSDNRLHTSLNQTVTATGRLSSSEPNLQNIPARGALGKEVRRAFVAQGSENVLLSADYSQIELRILAHLSEDPNLIEAFLEGQDIHTATASRVFNVSAEAVTPEMRRLAKAVNFGLIYGQREYGLARELGISQEEAKKFIEAYFATYSRVKEFLEELLNQARQLGYASTIFGRRRQLPDLHSNNATLRQQAERMAVNMPMQGSSADIIKLAMVSIFKHLKDLGASAKMILQIHDELLFEVPKIELESTARLVKHHMENAVNLRVPIVVELKAGKNWLDMDPLHL